MFNSNRLHINKLVIFFLVVLLALGSLFRVAFFSSHFSQDDEAIHLISRLNQYQKTSYIITIGPEENNFRSDIDKKHIRLFPQSPFAHKFTITPDDIRNNPLLYSLKIAHQMTYAPFYSFMAGFLIDDDDPYEKRLMQLRFPNLIFSILSIFLFSFLIFRLDNTFISGLLPVSVFSFAIMPSVYASQGIPYAFLIFLTILHMLLIQQVESRKEIKTRHAIAAAVLAVVAGYAHWMMLLSNLIFYLVLLIAILLYFKKQEKIKNFTKLILSFTCYSAIMMPGIFLFVIKKMAETSGREDFQASLDIELLKRIYLIVTSNLSILPEGSLINIILIHTVILAVLLGAVSLFRSKYPSSGAKAVMIYSILGPAAYVTAGIAGMVPLTPTRHTIYFAPLLLYMTGYGLNAILSMFKKNERVSVISHFLVCGITSIIIFVALLGFADTYKKRKRALDSVMTNRIAELADKYNVKQAIVFESMEPLLILKETMKIPVRLYSKAGHFDTQELIGNQGTGNTIMFISTSRSVNGSNPDFMDLIHTLYKKSPAITEKIAVNGVSMDVVSMYNDTKVFNDLHVSIAEIHDN